MRRLVARAMILMTVGSLAFGAGISLGAAPTISLTAFSSITTNSVTLKASINPNKKATLYHFEYGSAPCSSNACISVPIPDGEINTGKEEPIPVTEHLSGLTPGATYYFRVVAENAEGDVAEGPDRTFAPYIPSPVFAPCSNDSLRQAGPPATLPDTGSGATLPDCRAYEQATPVNKDGGDVTGTVGFTKAALGGGAISYLSSSGVPGGDGAQELPLYLASRGAEGWSSRGLLPPATSGQLAKVLGWTLDFSQVFDLAIKLGSPLTSAFLGRTPGGPPVTIAPYLANSAPQFAGASADGSKVVFESLAALPSVDGAIEGKSNVYVWDRASEKVSLVSVLNDGKAPSKGSFAGPYNWAKGTNSSTLAQGGAREKYYLQDEHAVTSDGSIFFTAAGTGQIYLRRNPTQDQSPVNAGKCNPALACTIQLSASRKTNGHGPDGTDINGPLPAAFQMATPDGAHAFFTSPEKLTNDAETGPEPDVTPTFGRADIDGKNPNEAFMTMRGRWIDIDGGHIYWSNASTGTIGRAELGGGNPEPEFISGLGEPQDVAVDAGHIYWSNAATNSIGRADIGGNPVSIELECVKGASEPRGIDVDAGHIYWINAETTDIGRANLNCSGPEQSFVDRPDGPDNGISLEGIAVGAGYVYFTEILFGVSNYISSTDLTGGNLVRFPVGVGKVRDVVIDANYVYWTLQSPNEIGRTTLDLNVTNQENEFLPLQNPPSGLALDDAHLYWTVNQELPPNPGNDLYRYDVSTDDLSDLSLPDATVPGGTNPNGAEVKGVLGISEDGSYLYFAANGVLTNTPNSEGESPSPGTCQGSVGGMSGSCNLYLLHNGAIDFIARLQTGGSETTDASNWAPTPEVFIDTRFQATARVTPDGHTLLFRSQRQLSDYDNEGKAELYLYRVEDPGLTCVSCNPTHAPPTRFVTLSTIYPAALEPGSQASVLSRVLSRDGNRVFFESTDPLVLGDTNGATLKDCPEVGSFIQKFRSCRDVYMWEAEGSGSCNSALVNDGCLYLLSTGKSSGPSFLADASADGRDAFFFTRSSLVGQDTDELLDVYDARIDGGLASQSKAPAVICEGVEACHGPSMPPPGTESPGSASFSGSPDPKPNRHHKRKNKKKRKKHSQKQKHHRAYINRGAIR